MVHYFIQTSELSHSHSTFMSARKLERPSPVISLAWNVPRPSSNSRFGSHPCICQNRKLLSHARNMLATSIIFFSTEIINYFGNHAVMDIPTPRLLRRSYRLENEIVSTPDRLIRYTKTITPGPSVCDRIKSIRTINEPGY